jgi:hypothetical protein
VPSTNLDFDWLYRRAGRRLVWGVGRMTEAAWTGTVDATSRAAHRLVAELQHD